MFTELANGVRISSTILDPADTPTAARLLDMTFRAVRESFDECGSVERTYSLVAEYPVRAILTIDPGKLTKDQAEWMTRELARDTQAWFATFTCEMWFVVEPRKATDPIPGLADYKGPLPSKRADRREGVVLYVDSPRLKPNRQQWSADITRDANGKPTLHEWHRWEYAEGRWVQILPDYPRTDAGHA